MTPRNFASGCHRLIIIRECHFLIFTILRKAFAGLTRHGSI
jgi:hypothetical protein